MRPEDKREKNVGVNVRAGWRRSRKRSVRAGVNGACGMGVVALQFLVNEQVMMISRLVRVRPSIPAF